MTHTGELLVSKTMEKYCSYLILSLMLLVGCDRADDAPVAGSGQTHVESGQQNTEDTQQASPSTETASIVLRVDELQKVFDNVNPRQKEEYLKDPEAFAGFVKQETAALSLSAAARANKIHEDQNVVFLMQRMGENVLREAYLNRLMAEKIPGDFPTADQVREYYESNRNQFVLEDRLHVWQIFLKVEDPSDNEEIKRQQTLAGKITEEIRSAKIDFGVAALQYSQHDPSRLNGGYMGFLKFSDMRPGLGEVLRSLAEGAVSDPILNDEGIHILRRGVLIPRQELKLEQIESEVRDLLEKQANAQLRQAIFNKATESYPVVVNDEDIETWRKQLLNVGDSEE